MLTRYDDRVKDTTTSRLILIIATRLKQLLSKKEKPIWNSSAVSQESAIRLRRDETCLFERNGRLKANGERNKRRKRKGQEVLGHLAVAAASAEGAQAKADALLSPGQDDDMETGEHGTSSVAVIKAAQEARKRAREREKIVGDAAIAEQRVIKAIMSHEECMQEIHNKAEIACESFRNATTKATAMHAFDGVTALLQRARLLTCQVCEAVVLWRKALDKVDAISLAKKGSVVLSFWALQMH